MHPLTTRARTEDGFVLVLALLIIVVLTVLTGTLVQGAVLTSSHGNSDYAHKQARADAYAGVQAALYRLSNQAEDTAAQQKECFTTKYGPKVSGRCPGQTDSLGNGSEYTYYVSPAFTQAENSCTGLWLVAPSGKEVNQRCITSIGTAHGVSARVQARVADVVTASSPSSLFPVNGLFSYSSLEFTNEVKLSGEIGARGSVLSNKKIENPSALTVSYGTTSTLKEGCKSTCTQTKLTGEQLGAPPFALPSQEAAPYAASQSANNNSSMKIEGCSGCFTEGTRELSVNSKSTITLPSGTYNLCDITINNEATIKYTPPIKLYVDSPNRTTGSPASNCLAGKGLVKMTNKITWKDEAATPKPSDLQIFVWGNPGISPPSNSSPAFEFNNAVGGPFYAMVYAPYSAVSITNTLNMVGSIAGGWIKMTNKVEVTGEGGGSGGGSGSGSSGTSFYATAYHQCPFTSSTSDPALGCY